MTCNFKSYKQRVRLHPSFAVMLCLFQTPVNLQENKRTYTWDDTNRLVRGTRGTDWNFYQSEYTYNAIGLRVNSTIVGPEKTIYDRDYVIDYTSPENNDIMEYNVGHYQWQGSKKVHDLRYTYNANGDRLDVKSIVYSQWGGSNTEYTLNVHEDIMGSATAYTYQGGWNNGQWANKHEYDVWGFNTKAPTYNYDPMYRSTEPYYTGHPYDGSLNIYFAENRFYDAETGTWLSPDPIKDGLNWYTYCEANPTSIIDILGLAGYIIGSDVLGGVSSGEGNNQTVSVTSATDYIFTSDETLNTLTTEQKFNMYSRLNPNTNNVVTMSYFEKAISCTVGQSTVDNKVYLDWYGEKSPVAGIDENAWKKAHDRLLLHLIENRELAKNQSIFFFEGLGNYSGDKNTYHPDRQYGAMAVVLKNGQVTFITQQASTLPDQYVANGTNCVLQQGVFSLSYTRHAGYIHGFNVGSYKGSDVWVQTFAKIPGKKELTYKEERCYAINIHSVAGQLTDDSNNSQGCLTMSKTEYVKFGYSTKLFDAEVFNENGEFSQTYSYSQIMGYSDENAEKMKMIVPNTLLVVDRSYMPQNALPFESIQNSGGNK